MKQQARIFTGLAILGLVFLTACASHPGTNSPGQAMPALSYPFQEGFQQDTLFVMLPGFNDSPRVFMENGMVAAAKNAGLVDVIAVDANYTYYQNHSIVVRLHDDIIGPARAAGYRHIWLVGASMGGYGALLYAQSYPHELEGIVLLAPFLGNSSMEKEFQMAGGVAAWHYRAGSGSDDNDRKVREIWFWLQQMFTVPKDAKTIDTPNPQIWLGCGLKDRFRVDCDRLAAILPAGQAILIPGAHDWKTWSVLFQTIVNRLKIKAVPSEL